MIGIFLKIVYYVCLMSNLWAIDPDGYNLDRLKDREHRRTYFWLHLDLGHNMQQCFVYTAFILYYKVCEHF